MRKNITLSVKTDDGSILKPIGKFAISGENYQGNLIFQLDKPIQGSGTIMIHKDSTIYQVPATHDSTYTEYYIPILNSILVTSGMINVQLKVTEPVIVDGQTQHTPIFESEITTGVISSAISAGIDDLEEYDNYYIIVDTLRNEVETAEGDIDSLEDRMTIAEQDIDNAEENITSLKGRMSTAEDNISTNTNNIRTNADDIDVLETHMGTAEDNISSLTQRMNSVEGRLDTLEGKVRTLEEKVSTLENKVQNLERYNYLVIEGE